MEKNKNLSFINILSTIFRKSIVGSISIIIIICTGLVAVFGYIIAPDSSQDANLMHISLANKPMGYSAKMLRIPIQNTTQKPFLQRIFTGENILYEEIPIQSYQVKNNQITYTELTGETKQLPLNSVKNPNEAVYTKTFYLGTDKYGRDFLSRIIIGTRISFFVGFIAVAISLLVGVTLGAISGYYGGKIDAFIMWLINIIWSIPTLLLVIAITLALGKGFWQIFVAVGLTMWVEVARITRGQFISLKEKEFVEAGRALGFSDFRLIFNHILPNTWGPIIVISAANFASAILVESGLSFLGIGAQSPTPSWGGIIKENYGQIILGYPHLALIPGTCMLLMVLAFMLLGNQLRDILDVKE